MERSTNALAELAERLKQAEVNIGQGYYTDDIRKAQRIVAELAKVLPLYMAGEPGHTFIETVAYKAYRNCRAIAEEGAGDDK